MGRKNTATVTVGADTKPFARKMRNLGRGIGNLGGKIQEKAPRAAMSGLRTGAGIGLGLMGIRGVSSLFDMMRSRSPELEGALNQLKSALGTALTPAAMKLAGFLTDNLPAINNALSGFGTMIGDALQFWTEDAFDPAVWKDIGLAIADNVNDAMKSIHDAIIPQETQQAVGMQFGRDLLERAQTQGRVSESDAMKMALGALVNQLFGDTEGPASL